MCAYDWRLWGLISLYLGLTYMKYIHEHKGMFSLLLKNRISDFYLTSLSPRTSTIVQFIFYFGPLRSAIIF